MRARLARAAFEVIRDQGYANFRTAAVAKQAGVSQGAQLHHFPTKNHLAIAAIEYAFGESTARALSFGRRLPARSDPLGAMLKDAQNFFLSAHFRVALDILMAGGAERALKQELINLTLKHRGQVECMWLEKLREAGWPPNAAKDALTMTMSLVRGLAVRGLVEDTRLLAKRMTAQWHLLAAQWQRSLKATTRGRK